MEVKRLVVGEEPATFGAREEVEDTSLEADILRRIRIIYLVVNKNEAAIYREE